MGEEEKKKVKKRRKVKNRITCCLHLQHDLLTHADLIIMERHKQFISMDLQVKSATSKVTLHQNTNTKLQNKQPIFKCSRKQITECVRDQKEALLSLK